ncbi:MAG: alpha/beta hydrolase [Acidobacteria bacterium]|nr:alpha/beta hydrolase [Acidobacteriota bacterium]
MILISCRKDFNNSRAFAKQNEIRNYQLLPALTKFETLTEKNLLSKVKDKRVLILIHGFRTTMSSVGKSYQRVMRGLIDNDLMGEGGYDLVLGFTWPGFETVLGFFPAQPFASRAGAYLRLLLEVLAPMARTIDIQTHSLGARVALQALSAGSDTLVGNLMLTAAAVDNEILQPRQEYHESLRNCQRCVVYHSNRDDVLKFAFRIGDALEFDQALGFNGPQNRDIVELECPNVFVVDCKKVVESHGDYRTAAAVYEHWGRVLSGSDLVRFEELNG